MNLRPVKFLFLFKLLIFTVATLQAQYIHEVMEYTPAPGQYINTVTAGSPHAALSIKGGLNGMLNLGAFGGYVIFRFENPVENHPENPYGVDFTIFGNPALDWSEPGIVSVMKDVNRNGLPDDTWYELAGSDHYFSSTIKGYEITYTNPHEPVAEDVAWTDNLGKSGYIFSNIYYYQPYYPLADSFPDINSNSYSLTGTLIKGRIDMSKPSNIRSYPRSFGYADNHVRGSEPFNVPDNPYTPETENSGGDAFDISWAIDHEGNYIVLDEIHFVRVHTSVLDDAGPLGEISTELTGAIDVSPDNSIQGVMDMIVIKDLPPEIDTSRFHLEVFVFHAGQLQQNKELSWTCSMQDAYVDNNNILTVNSPGELTLTATLADDPAIIATASIMVSATAVSVDNVIKQEKLTIFPNPVKNNLTFGGVKDANIYIYNINGKIMARFNDISDDRIINVDMLPEGIYIISIRTGEIIINRKIIKE